MNLLGIERQTKLIAILPILLIATLLESYFIYSRFEDLDNALLERSQLLARQLASSSEYPVFTGDATLLKQQVDSAMSFQDVQAITILDASFKPVLKLGQQGTSPVSLSPQTSLIVQDSAILRLYEPIQATQIRLDDVGLGGETRANKPLGMVIIEFSKARLAKRKTEIIVLNLLVTLIILSITLMIALRVARNITLPILKMRQAIIEIGRGALKTRISPKPAVRELYDLADGINNMALQLSLDRSTLEERIKQATLELRAKKEEAENANFSKTRFLAAASHDLRQPMHALGLFIGELQAIVNTQEQRKIVTKVEESIHAMSGLLNSLLDISKLDAGIVVAQPANFSVEKVLGRIAQNYRPAAEAKSIQFRIIPSTAQIHSDPILLERILLNLVGNALRYTPAKGRVMVDCRKRGNELLIEIRDNGIGIPAEEQKNIFREFVQLANKERDRSMGLGLGLAIVERLSRLLDHPVAVRSEPGKGSIFSVRVPLASSQSDLTTISDDSQTLVAPSELQENSAVSRGANILVVDDDPLVRSGTQGILSAWGYQVSVASSLSDLKSKFPKESFDLVICDYRLPDGNGLELAGYLNCPADRLPPCILVSGDISPDVLQEVTESGFNFLSKPVRPAKLRSLILFLLSEARKTR
ncbi:MAG TPA: ATP-binding protein [Gallionellaceae bacterium]